MRSLLLLFPDAGRSRRLQKPGERCMIRHELGVALLAGVLLACQGDPTEACSSGALCALHPTLIVTGHVRASINPLPGVTVTATAFRSGCSGATVALLPSPAQAVTDAQGLYAMALEPAQAAAAACLEIAYSSALKVDAPGIPLRIPPAAPETLHVDLVGP